MELATLDARKALAFDAACRGQREVAERLYGELLPHYERHGAAEGLLTIQLNRLLMALEDEDWHLSGALIEELTGRLSQLHGEDSPQIRAVAHGVWTLFRHPEEALDPIAVNALATAAAWWTGSGAGGQRPRDDAHERAEQITPDVLAQLPPEHALRLLVAANATPKPGAHEGLAALGGALQVLFEPQALAGTEPPDLGDYREACQGNDRFRAYQALVTAFERARRDHVTMAVELLPELSRMEGEGLPERLAYAPGLPVERRLRASAALHLEVAHIMARRARWGAAARVQYAHVVTLADDWKARMRARAARGVSRSGDVVGEATMALLKAEALTALGRRAEAVDELSGWLPRAMRCAVGPAALSARILLTSASLAERGREFTGAARLFAEAAEVALPGLTRGPNPGTLADRLDALLEEGAASQIPLAARALAGLGRNLADGGTARAHLARAMHLLTLARPYIGVAELIPVSLEIDLSMASWGSGAAAARAVEVAQAMDDPQARALALLYRSLSVLDGQSPGSRGDALSDLALAAAEAREAASGALRRTVELAAALCPLELEGVPDPDRVEVHLRRASEGGGVDAWPDGSAPWDPLLPREERFSAREGIRVALEQDHPELARRLAASVRQGALGPLTSREIPSWVPAVMAHHRGVFERWARVEGAGHFDPSVLDRLCALRPEGPTRRQRPSVGEAWLECVVFEGGTYLFLSTIEGTWGHWWAIPRPDLEVTLRALPALLHSGALQRDLARWCRRAYQALLAPFEDHLMDVERLVLCPDGPLWSMPLALLYEGAFVCEHVSTMVQCPLPAQASSAREGIETSPAVALIIGDGATARDLQLSTLAQEGYYSTVEARHGGDLDPEIMHQTIPRARMAYVVGDVVEEGIVLRDEGEPVPVSTLGRALSAAGVSCAIIQGPVHGEAAHGAIRDLLAHVPTIIIRAWETGETSPEFIMNVLRAGANAETPAEFARALHTARAKAIAERLPAHLWAAYETCAAEWC